MGQVEWAQFGRVASSRAAKVGEWGETVWGGRGAEVGARGRPKLGGQRERETGEKRRQIGPEFSGAEEQGK